MSDSYEFLKGHRDRIEAKQREPFTKLLDKLRAIAPPPDHPSVLLSASTFREIVSVLESAIPSHAEILSPESGKAHASAPETKGTCDE